MNSPTCFETEHSTQAFLRILAVREQRALPYALLVDMELSEDATALRLVFPHYEATVKGHNLGEVFDKIATTRCTLIRPGRSSRVSSDPEHEPAIVSSIHLKRLQPST